MSMNFVIHLMFSITLQGRLASCLKGSLNIREPYKNLWPNLGTVNT